MDFFTIIVGLIFAYQLISIFSAAGKPKNLPPGPTPLPIIGSLHLLGDQPHRSLAKLAKTYGPIMCLKLGRITTLVISSPAAAKEVLQKQDLAFANHHVPDALTDPNVHVDHSVLWLPVANQWRTLRKILNSNIFSHSRLDTSQHLRRQKVEELVAYCRKASLSNEPLDIGRCAFRTSLNLLSNTILSQDLTDPYEDSAKEFKELVGNIMIEAGKPNLVDFFPSLRKLDPQGIRRRMTEHLRKIDELIDGLITERLETKKSAQNGGNVDVLDVLLSINQEKPEDINRTHINRMIVDLYVAGTDTTSNTLEWAMTEVLRNPHTMAKAKEELEQVIGKGKMLEESDISNLPYLRCIIKETLRMHPPGPFLIPRKVATEVEIYGYTIPKGTLVFVNAWAIGRDSDSWEDALEFKPERFLNSEVDVRGQDFQLIPFGAGRRICPGLSLANRIIPVMLGSLLNNFEWELIGGIKPDELDMNEKFGISVQKVVPLRVVPMPLA